MTYTLQQTYDDMESAFQRTNSAWIRKLVQNPPIAQHTGIYQLHVEAKATLCTALVRESVRKPPGTDLEPWISSRVVGIYEEILWACAIMDDLCELEGCSRMSAGKCVHYSWQDGPGAAIEKLTAREYARKLCEYAQSKLANDDMIPQDRPGQPQRPFPKYFIPEMKTLLKRFFRIYAHLYIHHFKFFQDGGAEAHLNCIYKQYLFFVKEFDLVSDQDMAPLQELNTKFLMEHIREHAEAARQDAAEAAEEVKQRLDMELRRHNVGGNGGYKPR